jgi:diaminopropionate ammonia-lyase
MAGLNCGTVSSSAWPVLQQGCDAAVAVSDDEALRAVDDLGRLDVSSGPSGAATLAGVRAALDDVSRRTALDLDDDAVVVLLNTEGHTR